MSGVPITQRLLGRHKASRLIGAQSGIKECSKVCIVVWDEHNVPGLRRLRAIWRQIVRGGPYNVVPSQSPLYGYSVRRHRLAGGEVSNEPHFSVHLNKDI